MNREKVKWILFVTYGTCFAIANIGRFLDNEVIGLIGLLPFLALTIVIPIVVLVWPNHLGGK